MSPVTAAVSGMGCSIKWNANKVMEIRKISGPSMKLELADVTHYESPDSFREKIGTLFDGGEVTIEGNTVLTDSTGQEAMWTDFYAKQMREAIVTGPTGAPFTITFNAIISNMEPDYAMEGGLGFSATLSVVSKPVRAITQTADLTTLTGIEENTGAALTFTPTFDGSVYEYNVAVNTASTWVKLTPTLATATVKISNGVTDQSVLSGAQSGTIALAAAGLVRNIILAVTTPGDIAQIYTLHVYRA